MWWIGKGLQYYPSVLLAWNKDLLFFLFSLPSQWLPISLELERAHGRYISLNPALLLWNSSCVMRFQVWRANQEFISFCRSEKCPHVQTIPCKELSEGDMDPSLNLEEQRWNKKKCVNAQEQVTWHPEVPMNLEFFLIFIRILVLTEFWKCSLFFFKLNRKLPYYLVLDLFFENKDWWKCKSHCFIWKHAHLPSM